MGEEHGGGPPGIERLLRAGAGGAPPAPAADLVARTLRRVRDAILLGDLVRLATLEGLWSPARRGRPAPGGSLLDRADDDARAREARQDP